MDIKSSITSSGIKISLFNATNSSKEGNVIYSTEIWKGIGLDFKEIIKDNMVYSKLAHYSTIADEDFNFDSNKPVVKEFIDRCIIKDIPRIGFIDKKNPKILFDNFNRSKKIFRNYVNDKNNNGNLKTYDFPGVNDGGVLGLTFGKDSLLTYAVMKELEIPTKILYFKDVIDLETTHKINIIKKFGQQEKIKIDIVTDQCDEMFYDKRINKTKSDAIYASCAMNGYMIMALPLAYNYGVNKIVFGNEHTFNDHFIDNYGNKCYSSYDQTSEWMVEQNMMLDKITARNVKLISYVEPLYDLAEIKVLFNRYPEMIKFLMSCSHDNYESKKSLWCQKCETCNQIYLYLLANKIDPKVLGFKYNMMNNKFTSNYLLFNNKHINIYHQTKTIRDIQLLAFYKAYKNGYSGDLIEKFKNEYLSEAKEREEELEKKYYGVNKSESIPNKILKQTRSIYNEELDK